MQQRLRKCFKKALSKNKCNPEDSRLGSIRDVFRSYNNLPTRNGEQVIQDSKTTWSLLHTQTESQPLYVSFSSVYLAAWLAFHLCQNGLLATPKLGPFLFPCLLISYSPKSFQLNFWILCLSPFCPYIYISSFSALSFI